MKSSKETPPQTSKSNRPAAPRDASSLCKCKKSKCIRQYCICFRAGELCQGCDCVDCFNDGDHEQDRKAAIEHIKISDPLAFGDKVRDGDTPAQTSRAAATAKSQINQVHHVRGCKCKNSRCQKKYCECFEYGVSCSAKCGCKDCLNGKPPASDGSESGGDRKRKAPAMSENRRGDAVHATRGETALAEAREEKKAQTAPQTPQFSRGSVPFTPKDGVQPSATLSFSNTDWTASPLASSSLKGVLLSPGVVRGGSGKPSPLGPRRQSMSPGGNDRCLLFEGGHPAALASLVLPPHPWHLEPCCRRVQETVQNQLSVFADPLLHARCTLVVISVCGVTRILTVVSPDADMNSREGFAVAPAVV